MLKVTLKTILLLACIASICKAATRGPRTGIAAKTAPEIYTEFVLAITPENLKYTCNGIYPLTQYKLRSLQAALLAGNTTVRVDVLREMVSTACLNYLLDTFNSLLQTPQTLQLEDTVKWMREVNKHVNKQLVKRSIKKPGDILQFIYPLLYDEDSSEATGPPHASLFKGAPLVDQRDILNPQINTNLKKKLQKTNSRLVQDALESGQGLCNDVLGPVFGYLYHATLSLFTYMKDLAKVRKLIEDGRSFDGPSLYSLILVRNVCKHLQDKASGAGSSSEPVPSTPSS